MSTAIVPLGCRAAPRLLEKAQQIAANLTGKTVKPDEFARSVNRHFDAAMASNWLTRTPEIADLIAGVNQT
jgi:hypothetical protein